MVDGKEGDDVGQSLVKCQSSKKMVMVDEGPG
jgi:hypothetical protein